MTFVSEYVTQNVRINDIDRCALPAPHRGPGRRSLKLTALPALSFLTLCLFKCWLRFCYRPASSLWSLESVVEWLHGRSRQYPHLGRHAGELTFVPATIEWSS